MITPILLQGQQGDAQGLADDWEAVQRTSIKRSPKVASAYISAIALCGNLPVSVSDTSRMLSNSYENRLLDLISDLLAISRAYHIHASRSHNM